MYIYSVTIQIDKDAESAWLKYMQKTHVNEVLATGYFTSCSIRKSVPEKSSVISVYNMEYVAKNEADYISYEYEFAEELRDDVKKHFDGKFTVKRAFYEVILDKK